MAISQHLLGVHALLVGCETHKQCEMIHKSKLSLESFFGNLFWN